MKPQSVVQRLFLFAPILGAFFSIASPVLAQNVNVQTSSGGHGLRTAAQANSSDPDNPVNKSDAHETDPVADFTDYSKAAPESHVENDGTVATGKASLDAHVQTTSQTLIFTAHGQTSSSTNPPRGGAAGIASASLSFDVTQRCFFNVTGTAFVSTGGRNGSSQSFVGFSGSGTDSDEVEHEIDLDAEAVDDPGFPLFDTLARNGILYPGSYDLEVFTDTTLSVNQPAAVSTVDARLFVLTSK
jgi:hypothetical protein